MRAGTPKVTTDRALVYSYDGHLSVILGAITRVQVSLPGFDRFLTETQNPFHLFLRIRQQEVDRKTRVMSLRYFETVISSMVLQSNTLWGAMRPDK